MMQVDSDFALIQQCRDGDEAAWQTLYERYRRLLYHIPLRYGMSQDDAAEIVQRTLMILLESLHVFHEESNVKSWLATVARRQAWRYAQQMKKEMVLADGDLMDSDLLVDGAVTLDENDELAEWLYGGLVELPERCRELLLALYFEHDEANYDEISVRLGIGRGSMGPTRGRCLKKLRQLLSDA